MAATHEQRARRLSSVDSIQAFQASGRKHQWRLRLAGDYWLRDSGVSPDNQARRGCPSNFGSAV